MTYPPFSAPPDPMSAPPGSFSGPPALVPIPPAAKRSRGAVVALAAAAVALLVAVASMVVAWRAVDQAADARDIALASGPEAPAAQVPVTTAAPPPPSEPTATEEPADPVPSGTGAPPLNERTVYKPKYENQPLTLTAKCNYQMYADLDEPRANVGSGGYDISLTGACVNQPAYLSLGEEVEASTSGAASMTPHDCAERIRTSPLGDATIPARQGTVVCLTTSFTQAQQKGDDQRLVLFEITGVADDGAVTIKATAWDIPR